MLADDHNDPDDVDNQSDGDPVLASLLFSLASTFLCQRYLNHRARVPKSQAWYEGVLPALDARRFRVWTRMDRASFAFVLNQIEAHQVFKGGPRSHQASVASQLALALHRLGSNGTAGSVMAAAGHWGYSEGHILNCVRRVCTALASLRGTWVVWPDAQRRAEESVNSLRRAGLKGAIGKLDGTEVILYERPGGEMNGDEYFNREKNYAINLTAVCDYKLRFTYILAGWPGSVHDSRAWSVAAPQTDPARHFQDGEYLVADSAYAATTTVVVPYKKPQALSRPNRRFNKLISSIRIDIEHAFGLLKGRWGCLKGLRVRLLSKKQHGFICETITACVVLHNMLVHLQDAWNEHDELENDAINEGIQGEADMLAADGREQGLAWRRIVQARAFEHLSSA